MVTQILSFGVECKLVKPFLVYNRQAQRHIPAMPVLKIYYRITMLKQKHKNLFSAAVYL